MKNDTINITGLGELVILETYIYYDQPLLFSCISRGGRIYLAIAVDNNIEHITWLYVRVGYNRLNLIRSGEIDLYTALTEPEDGFLFQEIITYNDLSRPRMNPIQRVPQDLLPVPGEYLKIDIDPPMVDDSVDYTYGLEYYYD